MGRTLAFLFGTGWWIPWHLLLLSGLIPLAVLLVWFARFDPEGGPQGGEAALALLMLVVGILMVATLLHAGLWVRQSGGGLVRYLKACGVWVLGWVAAMIPVIRLANLSASVTAARGVRAAATAGLGLLLLAVFAANLLFLWWYQRR
jgi:hypothetical protein